MPLMTCPAGPISWHLRRRQVLTLPCALPKTVLTSQSLRRHTQLCAGLWQASIQRIELDLRWDAKEFPAALDRSLQLKPLPAGVEVCHALVCLLSRHAPGRVGSALSAKLPRSVRGHTSMAPGLNLQAYCRGFPLTSLWVSRRPLFWLYQVWTCLAMRVLCASF